MTSDTMKEELLLERFVATRDEAAFEALMRLHGPMVLGVCTRVLRNHHDAEEAFQATFLILSCKAASIMPRNCMGNWLYGVAYRTALKAQSLRDRRRGREVQGLDGPEPEIKTIDRWHEIAPLLDRELNSLPEKYRVPVVLCDLEGRSCKEVARDLNCPEGTLSSRLTRARSLLANRLRRQGVTLSVGALAVTLSNNAASAAVSSGLMIPVLQTVQLSASQSPVASGLISGNVVKISDGVLKSMLYSTARQIAIALGLLACAGLGATGLLQPVPDSVVKSSSATAHDVDLNAQLIQLLEDRDRRLMTFSAIVSFQEVEGAQYAEYLEASSDYGVFITRYAGDEQPRKDRSSQAFGRGKAGPTEYFRFVRLDGQQTRIERFEGTPNNELSNVQSCNCFNGTTWSYYTPADGGHLEISGTQRLTNAAAITGLDCPTSRIGLGQILELIRTANRENTLTVIPQEDAEGFPVLVATFKIPGRRSPDLPFLVTTTFNSRYGFAPSEFRGHEVHGSDNQRSLCAQSFVAQFSNWEEVSDGLHLAKDLNISVIVDNLLPVDQDKGFVPLLKDGKPIVDATGMNEISPESYIVTSYHIGTEIYHCTSVELLPAITTPLCTEQYPAGTVVQLADTGEVYRLQTEGAAIRDDMKAPLESGLLSPFSSPKEAESNAKVSNTTWVFIFANAIILGVILLVLISGRMRR